jgi:hypothetical protein
MNMNLMVSTLRSSLSGGQEPLNKTVKSQTVRTDIKEKYDNNKVVFSTREYSEITENVWTKGWRRVSDPEQRELSILDPYLSAIISTRVSQGAACSYPSESKYDKGCRISDLNPPVRDDYENADEFDKACAIRTAQQEAILSWVLTCGTKDEDVLNSVFANGDLFFKHCNFRRFVEGQIRNIMTFGRCGTQVLRSEDGVPVLFRPVPIETIFNAVHGEDMTLSNTRDTMEQSESDVKLYNEIKPEEKPAAYIQKINGQNVNFYSEDELKVWHWQFQALFGLNGYPLSPIELTIFMVFVHQQTLGYLRNQFVKGMAAKGLLCLESTNAAVELSPADLDEFRRQFHNFATRNDNSAVMPVISGPIKANFIQLSPSPRDMEFLQVEEHVIRALCSAFQISPQEMGYGHLSLPQGGLNSGNKQEDIIRGEERGLRQVLDIVFDGVNDIIYENFPEARDNFRLGYVGVGEETRDAAVQRQSAELTTTATMNSLWSDSEKTDAFPFAGDAPLNPQFNTLIAAKMFYGEYREHFFGDEGASKKPEYRFLMDPNLNQAYQQLLVQPVAEQRQQAEMQNKMMAQQMQQQQLQAQMAAQGGQPGAEGAPQEGQPQEQVPDHAAAPEPEAKPEAPAEPAEKSEEPISLREKFLEVQGLRKSMGSYFGAWVDAHYTKEE